MYNLLLKRYQTVPGFPYPQYIIYMEYVAEKNNTRQLNKSFIKFQLLNQLRGLWLVPCWAMSDDRAPEEAVYENIVVLPPQQQVLQPIIFKSTLWSVDAVISLYCGKQRSRSCVLDWIPQFFLATHLLYESIVLLVKWVLTFQRHNNLEDVAFKVSWNYLALDSNID